jgi:hypothetical protein
MIKTRYNWSKEKEGFIGIVYHEIHDEMLVLTVGIMNTEEGIKNWLKDTVERRAWEDESELPDRADSVQ